MFTGIIQSVGTVTTLQSKDGAVVCRINPHLRRKWKKGESVSVNGICSTVIAVSEHSFRVMYMPHTVNITTVKQWKRGGRVNIEPSLRAGDEISGHFVMGHVDGVARIVAARREKGQTSLTIQVPTTLVRYSIPRGSVALDGVSLTITGVQKDMITVNITPFTLSHTTLSHSSAGELLNIEIDTLARYLLWKPTISKRKKRA